MRFRCLVAFGFACGASPAFAGGSVDFDNVDRLLRQQPAVYQWLASSLVFPGTAYAEVRFGSHFDHLAGGRMGPYSFLSRPKSGTADGDIRVVVCTVATFVDADGKPLPDDKMFAASRVDETLTTVQVQGASLNLPPATCSP